jgi:tetratricopeptide (TPR) repeat protein
MVDWRRLNITIPRLDSDEDGLMKRIFPWVVAAACLVGQTRVTWANPKPTEAADALNEEGKSLYKNQEYPGAAQKFRQAIELSPEARYYFNLCATLEKLQDLDGALEACDSVYAHEPTDELKGKTGARAASIRAAQKKRADEQAKPVTPPASPPVASETGNAAYVPPATPSTGQAAPPPQGHNSPLKVYAFTDPLLDYRWSLGVELGVMTSGMGRTAEQFQDSGGTLKIHTSYYVWPEARLGVQGYLEVSVSRAVDMGTQEKVPQLSIVDLGGALYHHRKLSSNLFVTPLAGLHLSGLQPYQDKNDPLTFSTFGVKLEAAFSATLGDGRHIVSLTPMLSYYFPASDTEQGFARDFGFDKGGTVMALTLGYTHRFKQGLSGPLIVLE